MGLTDPLRGTEICSYAPDNRVMHPDQTAPQPDPTSPIHARRPVAANFKFLLAHPAHLLALGFASGLSPKAPGTMGTLFAWAVFVLLENQLTELQWGLLIAASVAIGWWICGVTARHLQLSDPSCIVWDEIAAFWLVLWLVSPTGLWGQLAAFALFRFFDAVKMGPVAWADQLFHGLDAKVDRFAWHKAGWGIMLDDLVAAFCTLLVLALWRLW